MSQFVTMTLDGASASVAPNSVRVWLDKGWKLVEEEQVVAVEVEEAEAETGKSSEVQTEGSPTVNEPQVVPPPPVQPAVVRSPQRATVPPADTGQEA